MHTEAGKLKNSYDLSELLLKCTNASFTAQLAIARTVYWPGSGLILEWIQECQNPSNEPI